jgi:hypothetical protein
VEQQLTQQAPPLSMYDAVKAKRILDQVVSEVRGYQGADLAAARVLRRKLVR